jgi:hypothetical protein
VFGSGLSAVRAAQETIAGAESAFIDHGRRWRHSAPTVGMFEGAPIATHLSPIPELRRPFEAETPSTPFVSIGTRVPVRGG